MGGSAIVGIRKYQPSAQYNYWEDPEAASIVYRQMEKMGKQIEMIGLDVTRQIVLTPDLLSYIERLDPREGAVHPQDHEILL